MTTFEMASRFFSATRLPITRAPPLIDCFKPRIIAGVNEQVSDETTDCCVAHLRTHPGSLWLRLSQHHSMFHCSIAAIFHQPTKASTVVRDPRMVAALPVIQR